MRLKFPGLPAPRNGIPDTDGGTPDAHSGTDRTQTPRTTRSPCREGPTGLIQPEIEGDSINARFLRLIIK